MYLFESHTFTDMVKIGTALASGLPHYLNKPLKIRQAVLQYLSFPKLLSGNGPNDDRRVIFSA